MGAGPDIHLDGAASLIEKLDQLGKLDDGKALRAAVRAGFVPVWKSARANAPVGKRSHRVYTGERVNAGYTKAHIKLITTISRDKKTAMALVGPSKRAFYATQFIERGWLPHSGKKGTKANPSRRRKAGVAGRSERGSSRVPPNPWLRRSFWQNRGSIQEAMVERLRIFIKKVTSS